MHFEKRFLKKSIYERNRFDTKSDAQKKGQLIFVQKKPFFLVVQLKVYFYLKPDQKEGDFHIW